MNSERGQEDLPLFLRKKGGNVLFSEEGKKTTRGGGKEERNEGRNVTSGRPFTGAHGWEFGPPGKPDNKLKRMKPLITPIQENRFKHRIGD